ncbi:MAG: GNAT family N-acetyltransferase [Desulfovibrio sp.]|jgi:phosphinothricin acetyltransferase|nr:GNAT family N-acetyltransferase [Desulfovibrio sp.]
MAAIRYARRGDAVGIIEIYAPYVRDTAVSFEEDVPSPDEYSQRIAKIGAVHPFLVCEAKGRIAAYAYASPFRVRAAYRFSVELSIYVAAAGQGAGFGKILYSCLLDLLRKQGFYIAFGVITLPNPASLALHESLGFVSAGVWRKAGYKLNSWHDLALVQKELLKPDDLSSPAEPLPAPEVRSRFGADFFAPYEARLNTILSLT